MNSNPTAKAALTEKQLNVLNAIAKAAEMTSDNHIERKSIKFSPDVFNALKKKELVGAHGKYVWITKAGLKLSTEPAVTSTEIIAQVNAADAEKDAAEKKTKKEPSGPTLDWAFRRLRRQLLIWGADQLSYGPEEKSGLRERLEVVESGYSNLRSKFESLNDFKNLKWEDFMEFFFGHEIHPGSRK